MTTIEQTARPRPGIDIDDPERLTALTGWLTLILSFTTCTIPGYLLLLGEWEQVPTWLVLVVIAGTVAALLPLGVRALRPGTEAAGRADLRAPVSAS